MEKSIAVPRKIKHRMTVEPSDSTPRNIHKGIKNKYLNKYTDRHVDSSTVHNSQKAETTNMAINE